MAGAPDDPQNGIRERVKRLEDDLRTVDHSQTERYHSLKAGVEAVGLLTDHQRRNEAALVELDDRVDDIERSCTSHSEALVRCQDRLVALENLNIAVIASQVADLRRTVNWLIVALATLILTTLGSLIVYLVTTGRPS